MSRPETKKQPEPEIRLATANDSEQIAEVVRRAFGVYRANYTPEAFAVVTPDADEFSRRLDVGPQWVVELDGKIVGTVSVTVDDGDLYVKTMAVDPSLQGRGIANLLMEAIDAYAVTTDHDRIFLYTTYFSAGAKQLYEKHGYRWVRDTPPEEWYGVAGLEMEKMLRRDGVVFKRVGMAHVDELNSLSEAIYLQHFPHLWHDGGAEYVERSFSRQSLTEQIADERNEFYFVRVGGELCGFLKLRPWNSLDLFAGDDAFEIERIYLDSSVIGTGLGRKAMEFSLERARSMNKDIVWLKVMDSNEKTVRFYEKLGFEKVGTERLEWPLMKDELRGMFVMRKDLKDK